MKQGAITAGVALLAWGVLSCVGWGQTSARPSLAPPASGVYVGVTHPSETRALNFNGQGIIRDVKVKEGDEVTDQQLLMIQDDRLQQAELKSAKQSAESTVRVDFAKSELKQKETRFNRIRDLHAQGRITSKVELEDAELEYDLAMAKLKVAEEEAYENRLKMEVADTKLELTRLQSTIPGIVQSIGVKQGEVADPGNPNKPAIVVVQLDPLKIETYLPLQVAGKLKVGDELEMRYRDGQEWLKAKVIFLDPVAASVGSRLVKLEMPNSQKREAGWEVDVRVPQALAASSVAR